MAKGRRTSRNIIAADLARIINKNPRASRYYQAAVIDKADGTHEISCERKQDAYDQTDSLFGCYVLRTCSQRLSEATDWWHLYMTLARAENGFRALKSDLGLRPIRHQLADRAKSHILISVLAYHLLQFIAFTLAKTGDHRSWETLRRILGTHCYTTIVLPTTDGTIHRLRKPGTPDQAQQQIYQALNIDWRTLPSIHTTA
jgi:hypothetical protein